MTDKIMGAFEDLLQTYQQNYLEYRLTGNAAKKTAYESAQQSIESYLGQLRGSLQSNTEHVNAFLQEYARATPELTKSQQMLQKAKVEGPKLQDDFTRQKKLEEELPEDWTSFYIKAGVVGGIAVVIAVVGLL